MKSTTTISVNNDKVSVRGKVELRPGWLSVGNNPSVRRLLRLLTANQVEGQPRSANIKVDGELIDQPFILHIRAPRKVVQEG